MPHFSVADIRTCLLYEKNAICCRRRFDSPPPPPTHTFGFPLLHRVVLIICIMSKNPLEKGGPVASLLKACNF